MRQNRNLLALKPYIESIKKHCKGLSKEELLDIILGLSRDIPAKGRYDFLNKISDLSQKQVSPIYSEDILEQIQALKEDIHDRMDSIEDGSYYDDYDGWDHYDEEEPDPFQVNRKINLKVTLMMLLIYSFQDSLIWQGKSIRLSFAFYLIQTAQMNMFHIKSQTIILI